MHLLGKSRRRFLQTAAAAAACSPLAQLLVDSVAHAEDGDVPCRLLLVYTPHGTSHPHWRPQVTGSGFNIDYPESILAPLAPFQEKLCIIEGLDMLSAYAVSQSGHEGGMASMFTGGHRIIGEVDTASHPSIDQLIGDHLQTQYPVANRKLNLLLGLPGSWGFGTSAFFEEVGSGVQLVVGESNTLATFNRLFGGLTPDGPSPEQLALVARKQSILDVSRAEVDALRASVGGIERDKMETHLAAIDDLQARLDLPQAACTPPMVEGSGDEIYHDHSRENLPNTVDELTDIVTQSLACRLTHVVGLQLLFSGAGGALPFLGIDYDVHNGLAHLAVGNGEVLDEEPYRTDYLKMQTYWTTLVANLLGKLDSVVEENGRTLLDNTIVCWMSDMGDCRMHSNCDLPIVLAGGAGQIEMGRYLQYFFSNGSHGPHLDGTGGAPHNHLLTSLCNAFGMNLSGVGNPDYAGTLEGL